MLMFLHSFVWDQRTVILKLSGFYSKPYLSLVWSLFGLGAVCLGAVLGSMKHEHPAFWL